MVARQIRRFFNLRHKGDKAVRLPLARADSQSRQYPARYPLGRVPKSARVFQLPHIGQRMSAASKSLGFTVQSPRNYLIKKPTSGCLSIFPFLVCEQAVASDKHAVTQ